MNMHQKKVEEVFNAVQNNRGITFGEICEKVNVHPHTIRKALKLLVKRGVVAFNKIGPFKYYKTMHDLLMRFTTKERDEIYYNYLKQYEFGVTLSKASKDLKMDKRSFRKDIRRLLRDGKISMIKRSNVIIYKAVFE